MLSKMFWMSWVRSFHVAGLKTYLLDGVDEIASTNWVPKVPKSPTAIVTIVTPSPFIFDDHCFAFAACVLSGTGSGTIDRQVWGPDMGLSGVHGTPSVMMMASLTSA